MKNNSILEPGTKIASLRKEHHLTQSNLVSRGIDRSTLSRIENNIRQPTLKELRIIINNYNKYVIDEEKLTEKDLAELAVPVSKQIDNILKIQINKFKNIEMIKNNTTKLKNELKNIEDLINLFKNQYDYNFNNYDLYDFVAKFFFRTYNYKESIEPILHNIELALSNNNYQKTFNLFVDLTQLYLKLPKYDSIIRIGNLSLKFLAGNDNKYKIKNNDIVNIYFNMIIAYEKNKQYNECITIISKFKSLYISEFTQRDFIDLDNIEGMCYFYQGNLIKAEDIIKNRFRKLNKDDLINKQKFLQNLLNIYSKQKKHKESVKCTHKLFINLEQLKYTHDMLYEKEKAITLYYVTQNYVVLDNIDLVYKFFKLSINSLLIIKDYENILNLIDSVLNYYIKLNLEKKVYDTIIQVNLVLENAPNEKFLKFYLKAIEFFFKCNNNNLYLHEITKFTSKFI